MDSNHVEVKPNKPDHDLVFTPRPWESTRNHDGDLIVSQPGNDGQVIVFMRGADGPEWEANARIIAAAKDGFAALALWKAMEDAGAHDADTRWKKVRKMRDDFLARARGQDGGGK